ncbi:MAG: zinc ribbon domain-containing protein [Lachnospiraceae bacterium]|nr:zinc ribbon domain-containing protein [Lachnospiraceae bacterium]
MVCSNCGAKLRKDSLFCHKCGTRIEDITVDTKDESLGVNSEIVKEEAEGDITEESLDKTSGEEIVKAAEAPSIIDTDGEKDTKTDINTDTDTDINTDTDTVISYDEYFEVDEEEEKKKKKNIVIGILSVAALVVLICFCNSNTFKRTFYKPSDYYKYIEKKNSAKAIKLVSNWYDVGSMIVPGDGSIGNEESMTIDMSQSFLEDISDALDLNGAGEGNLNWLSRISVSGKSTVYDDKYSRNTSVVLGDTTILTFNTITDLITGYEYIRVPELNDKYVGIDKALVNGILNKADDYTENEIIDPLFVNGRHINVKYLPEAYKVSRLLDRYSDIVIDNMEDVKLSKKQKLEIGGVDQKCYCLTVDMDYKTTKALADDIITALTNDKDVKDIYVEYKKNEGLNGEEEWRDFLDSLDVLEEILTESAGSKMNVFVDTRGNIIAREIVGPDSDMNIRIGRTINGRTFGMQFVIINGEDEIVALRGNGKKAGSKYNGDFDLSIGNVSILDFTLDSFDYKAFANQKLNGQITFDISQMTKALNIGDDNFLPDDYKAIVSVESVGNASYKTKVSLSDGVTEPVNIDYRYSKTGGSRISVPEDTYRIESLSDFKEYFKDADFGKIKNNLESAGVPESVSNRINYLEKAVDYIDYIDVFF